MDFNDTPEEAEFRSQVRRWLAANAQRRHAGVAGGSILAAEAMDAAALARARAWQGMKAAAGYAAVTWPQEYGGMGGTPMQGVIYAQEEAQFDVSSDLFIIGLGLAMPMLMVLGTPEQKQRFIRPALEGREIWCQLFSEPGAGSDLAGVRTRAVKDGDDWIINGQKIWTSFGHLADWGILVARSDPAKPKHKGLSFFLLDMKTPGVTVRQIRQISGASGFNEVFFENVRIPGNRMVGQEGDGWKAAITVLMNERVVTGHIAGTAGTGELIALARGTRAGDGPALHNAAIREKIADWHVQSEGLKYIHYRSLTALSRGGVPGPENSVAKVVNAVLGQDLSAFALELMDTGGIMHEPGPSSQQTDFQEEWISSPGMRLAGGADDILRNIIAEQVLGLPGDVRVDKDIPFNAMPGNK